MVTFFLSLVVLFLGYWLYSKVVDKIFGANPDRPTPAVRLTDGVDYVPLSWKRSFLIQLLNIAGLGPVFGAIQGALWGPAAFLWIVLGGIFAGAVHDYLSGMLSLRHNGTNVPTIVGYYLGPWVKQIFNIFTVILLILVGTVFMTGPAQLLAKLTPEHLHYKFWLGVILLYYFLATLLPIDKIIGRLYPIFGAILIIMAVGIIGGLLTKGYHLPELTLANLHPKGAPLWPLLFITIACGAISGFHATQSPIIARCLENERYGRRVFYGAMIVESIIALIWAAAAIAFFGGTKGLAQGLASLGGPAGIVHNVSMSLLGTFGGVLAILGVVVLPITSGDTAFRAARLTIAEFWGLKQGPILNRYKIAIPLFIVGFTLSQIDFTIIWRYFAWSNQTLAMVVLWAGAVYLAKQRSFHWIATIPAVFMTAVSVTYILQAPEGLRLSTHISYPVGIVSALLTLTAFLWKTSRGSTSVLSTKPETEMH